MKVLRKTFTVRRESVMKITKLEHSCLLVEMPEPVSRTVLFDPGSLSEPFIDIDSLEFLDDIFITHSHPDHFHPPLLKKLVAKFPDVRITSTREVVNKLKEDGIAASHEEPDGVVFFDSKHEKVLPLFKPPEQLGFHYLDMLSHPGDSHSFNETMPILALPVSAPWGAMVNAVKLALELKPQYVLPIHDWHWREEAKQHSYDLMESVFKENGITFLKLQNGEPVVIHRDELRMEG
jgi:L-ascorbate metabolism protein UlaG (beta-lactamase superfamily)